MNRMIAIAVGALLVLVLLIFSTTYTVAFHEVAIRSTFGETSAGSVKLEPGLEWKWPIVQDRRKHDRRLQVRESSKEEIVTADGQQIVVQGFLLWRIDTARPEAVLEFDRRYGSVDAANDTLIDPFVTALAGTIGRYRLDELLGEDHRIAEAEQRIVESLGELGANGILPVAAGISQILLPERTTNSVIRRMEATRAKQAEARRYQGNAEAEGIQSRAATVADRIRAFADLRAAEIRSQANERAAAYLAQMGEEEELAIFLAWLDTLETALQSQSTFVLDFNQAPFHMMNMSTARDESGIPTPPDAAPSTGDAVTAGDAAP